MRDRAAFPTRAIGSIGNPAFGRRGCGLPKWGHVIPRLPPQAVRSRWPHGARKPSRSKAILPESRATCERPKRGACGRALAA
jgi:hypothetical protein